MCRAHILGFIILTGCLVSKADYDVRDDIFFLIYGNSTFNYANISLIEGYNLLKEDKFDSNLSTTIYIPGYTEKPDSLSVMQIISAYIQRGPQNVILLDWSKLSDGNYFFYVLPNVPKVVHSFTIILHRLIVSGLDVRTLTLTGLSLGAQISGQVGRNIQKFNIVLPRIIGLDPAFPGFFQQQDSLNSGDAEFVYCLHTDAGVYGSPFKVCDVDFWVNGGTRIQPGCLFSFPYTQSNEDYCSHKRVAYLWIEALYDNDALIGVKCNNNTAFQAGICDYNDLISFNTDTPKSARGNYYLKTNSQPPYSQGIQGIYNE